MFAAAFAALTQGTTTFGPIIIPQLTGANVALLLTGLAQALIGLEEFRGKHVPYSKFASGVALKAPISSRNGMLIVYSLGLLASFVGLVMNVPPNLAEVIEDNTDLDRYRVLKLVVQHHRAFAVAVLMFLHFVKRQLEVLTLHRFSGNMERSAAVQIGLGYGVTATMIIWCTAKVPQAAFALAAGNLDAITGLSGYPVVGGILALFGMMGNWYHHLHLSVMRPKNSKEYVIPTGALFDYVVCPQYTFELLTWLGIALTSQHAYAFCVLIAMSTYLAGRSYSTKQWYWKTFGYFPPSRKLLIPFVL